MKKSYYIELNDGQLVQYFNLLKDAKSFGEKLYPEFKIIKLNGPYKYEGTHSRTLEFKNGLYKVIKK